MTDDASLVARYAPLFRPRTVAVVGASEKGNAPGNVFIRNLREAGYEGAIFPIHPTSADIDGLPAYRTLADTPAVVDYAYVAVAAERVPAILAAGANHVRYAQVMSGGFSEVTGGEALEQQALTAARDGGMRLLGPNCMGTYSPAGRLTFMGGGVGPAGDVGVVSQSGGLSLDILRQGRARGIGFSAVLSLGNCADVGPVDMLDYFLADPATRVIGMYLEHVADGRAFFARLRAAGARKPVVILKGGQTDQGQRAATSHTGALAGAHEIWRGMARQTGTVLVASLAQFIDVLAALQAYALRDAAPRGRVVLFGNGGGTSVLATDYFARRGLDVAPLGADTIATLAALRVSGTSFVNPIDIPANVLVRDHGSLALTILDTLATREAPDALVVHLNLPVIAGYRQPALLGELLDVVIKLRAALAARTHVLLVLRTNRDAACAGQVAELAPRLADARLPVFDELADAGDALVAIHQLETFRRRAHDAQHA
ncbi:MAG: CoA-binding protein [Proteobacteria bacterium]|nr:CoA-binding protein [Pseudomonadota bacterium]